VIYCFCAGALEILFRNRAATKDKKSAAAAPRQTFLILGIFMWCVFSLGELKY